jgi:mRNA-degrading endonuclease toxin of MazEF toxin-antitoxin module
VSTTSVFIPRRGEVYWLDFAPATGQEMTGSHPCVVVQNDVGNQHSALTIVVAVTSNLRVAVLPIGVLLGRLKSRLRRTLRPPLYGGQAMADSANRPIAAEPRGGN